ncbi:hypothetical protein B7P43_G01117, partial [Cryptotermes secundus]
FFLNDDSATQIQRKFWKHFNIGRNDKVPKRQTILNWVSQFRSTVSALLKNNSDRPRSVRNPEDVETLRVAHPVALRMSDRSVKRMLHIGLHFHPFKIQMVLELLPRDLNMRRDSCTKLFEMLDALPQFLPTLITSDEAHFHVSEYYVNKQNFRYCAEENLRLLHQSPLHSQQVGV